MLGLNPLGETGIETLGLLTLKKIAVAIQNNNCLSKLDLHGNPFMGSQRLAAIPTISEATQPALGLLEEIKKLSTNEQHLLENTQDKHTGKSLL